MDVCLRVRNRSYFHVKIFIFLLSSNLRLSALRFVVLRQRKVCFRAIPRFISIINDNRLQATFSRDAQRKHLRSACRGDDDKTCVCRMSFAFLYLKLFHFFLLIMDHRLWEKGLRIITDINRVLVRRRRARQNQSTSKLIEHQKNPNSHARGFKKWIFTSRRRTWCPIAREFPRYSKRFWTWAN